MVREMPTKSEFLRETQQMLLDIKILKSPECGKTKIKLYTSVFIQLQFHHTPATSGF